MADEASDLMKPSPGKSEGGSISAADLLVLTSCMAA